MNTYLISPEANTNLQLPTPELNQLSPENMPRQLEKEEESTELQFVAILSSN